MLEDPQFTSMQPCLVRRGLAPNTMQCTDNKVWVFKVRFVLNSVLKKSGYLWSTYLIMGTICVPSLGAAWR